MHGTRMLAWSQIRDEYGRELVNLRNESRWVFLNTLFSVSEAVMYMQVCNHSPPCTLTMWLSQVLVSAPLLLILTRGINGLLCHIDE